MKKYKDYWLRNCEGELDDRFEVNEVCLSHVEPFSTSGPWEDFKKSIHVIEHQAVTERDEIIRELEGTLIYYTEQCGSCNWPGEEEYRANGCPSCDCLQARYALIKLKKWRESDL